MDVKFMQELHNKEFALKESLAQRASTIIAGLTTLGGLLAFVAINYEAIEILSINVMFWLLAIASSITLLSAIYYLIWSYRVPPLNDIGKPKEWLSYWNCLQKKAKEGELVSAEEKFTDYLLNQYAEVGEGNIATNTNRGERLVTSNNFLLTSFALVVLTSLVFYFSNYVFSTEKASSMEGKKVFAYENSLVCIPAISLLEANNRGGPKPRPVPNPGPSPRPSH
ncbi:hypothetical protein [Halomonas salina]|uniref:hypothetical protein n=1 Tax=Halomonas salina TaxID=42565 RepID=UPI0012682199|nr:hypothetical protein [Halomonas salina]